MQRPSMSRHSRKPLLLLIVMTFYCNVCYSHGPTNLEVGIYRVENDKTVFYCQGFIDSHDWFVILINDKVDNAKYRMQGIEPDTPPFQPYFKDFYYNLYNAVLRLYFPFDMKQTSGNLTVECIGMNTGEMESVEIVNYVSVRDITDKPVDYSILDLDTDTPASACVTETKADAGPLSGGIFEMGDSFIIFYCQTLLMFEECFRPVYGSTSVSASSMDFEPNPNITLFTDFIRNEFHSRYREYFYVDTSNITASFNFTCIGEDSGGRVRINAVPKVPNRTLDVHPPTFPMFHLDKLNPSAIVEVGCTVLTDHITSFSCPSIQLQIYENPSITPLKTHKCQYSKAMSNNWAYFQCVQFRPPQAGNYNFTCVAQAKTDQNVTVVNSQATLDAYETPALMFAEDCQLGYIFNKSDFNCTCLAKGRRTDFFTLVWKATDMYSSVEGTPGEDRVTFTHDYNSSISLISRKCVAILTSTQEEIETAEINITYAYGPSNILVEQISMEHTLANPPPIVCVLDKGDHSPMNKTTVSAQVQSDTNNVINLTCEYRYVAGAQNHSYDCAWVPPSIGNYTVLCSGYNGIYPKEFNATSEPTAVAIYGLPTVRLTNCSLDANSSTSQSTVGNGTASCTCELADAGFPAAEPTWYDQGGQAIAKGSSMTVLTVNASHEVKNFSCQATSSYGQSQKQDYQAAFIYGPSEITVLPIQDFLTMSDTPTVFCDVPQGGDSPPDKTKVMVEILMEGTRRIVDSINCTEKVSKGRRRKRSVQKRTFNCPGWTPKSVGRYIARCNGYNGIYPDMFNASSEREFAIYGPPSVKLTNCSTDANSTTLTTVGMEPSTCTCELSDPGYPPAKPKWYDQENQVVAIGSPNALLTVTAKHEKQSFSCLANSSFGSSQRPEYQAVFIYGPSNITLLPLPSHITVLDTPTFSCQLRDGGDAPQNETQVMVDILSEDTNSMVGSLQCPELNPKKGIQFHTYQCPPWRPVSAGRFKVLCKGYNGIYPLLFNDTSEQESFEVFGNSSVKLTNCSFPIVGRTTGSCACEMTVPGYNPAKPFWYDQSGKMIATDSSAAILEINSGANNMQTFTCKGKSSYGESKTIDYKAEFVYGPDNVVVDVVSDSTIDDHVMFYCGVHQTTIKPGWNSSFRVLGVDTNFEFDRVIIYNDSDISRALYKVNTTNVVGKLTVECTVNNTKISPIGAVASKEIILEAPAPAENTEGEDALQIALGTTGAFVFVWAIVLGGCCYWKAINGKKMPADDQTINPQVKHMVTPKRPGLDPTMHMALPNLSEISYFGGHRNSQVSY